MAVKKHIHIAIVCIAFSAHDFADDLEISALISFAVDVWKRSMAGQVVGVPSVAEMVVMKKSARILSIFEIKKWSGM